LIEVHAVGTAVVATDIAAAREQIDDGETGIIVSPRDSEEIAEAIRRLYFDANLRREMGKRGSVRVRQKYPIQTMVDQDLHVLQSCSN
jgi:glycosyltransferase involved in cell wall biosynthesis